MKKLLFASILLISSFVNAQDFQGVAVYESKTSTSEFMKGMSGNRELPLKCKSKLRNE